MARPPVSITFVSGWVPTNVSVVARQLVAAVDGEGVVVGQDPRAGSHSWVVPTAVEVVRQSASCPCCAVRLDLVHTVGALVERRHPPAWVVIDAGGPVDLATAVQTCLIDPVLRRRTLVDGLVTVVEGPKAATRVATDQPLLSTALAIEQLAMADRIVVASADRLSNQGKKNLENALRVLNPLAPVTPEEGWADLLNLRSFDPEVVAARLDALPAFATSADAGAPGTILLHLDREVEPASWKRWLEQLARSHAAGLLRLSGVVPIQGRRARQVRIGVRSSFRVADEAEPGMSSSARLLLVGRNLDGAGLQASLVQASA